MLFWSENTSSGAPAEQSGCARAVQLSARLFPSPTVLLLVLSCPASHIVRAALIYLILLFGYSTLYSSMPPKRRAPDQLENSDQFSTPYTHVPDTLKRQRIEVYPLSPSRRSGNTSGWLRNGVGTQPSLNDLEEVHPFAGGDVGVSGQFVTPVLDGSGYQANSYLAHVWFSSLSSVHVTHHGSEHVQAPVASMILWTTHLYMYGISLAVCYSDGSLCSRLPRTVPAASADTWAIRSVSSSCSRSQLETSARRQSYRRVPSSRRPATRQPRSLLYPAPAQTCLLSVSSAIWKRIGTGASLVPLSGSTKWRLILSRRTKGLQPHIVLKVISFRTLWLLHSI
jgi:hypothetical protein